MASGPTAPTDYRLCRRIVDCLRDGVPPPPEAVEYLSVGYEGHLEEARRGLVKAREGGYARIILEGPYGIGKSHLLNRVGLVAEGQGFVVRHVEIGSSLRFNDPDGIFKNILDGDWMPERPYPGHGNMIRKFVGELKALTEMHVGRHKAGLVVLFDEVENTLRIDRYSSRKKAYRVLGALFRGRDEGYDGEYLKLSNMLLMMAITPGTLEAAREDGWDCMSHNPAQDWKVTGRRSIFPLRLEQACELSRRIRAVHGIAFKWQPELRVPGASLDSLCLRWCSSGDSRDERQLVRQVIETLEAAEQAQ